MADRFGKADDPRAWEREEVARVCLHAQPPVISTERLIVLCRGDQLEQDLGAAGESRNGALIARAKYDLALARLSEVRDSNPQVASVWTNSLLAMTTFGSASLSLLAPRWKPLRRSSGDS